MVTLSIHASSLDRFNDCPRAAVADRYAGLLQQAGYEVKEPAKYVTPIVGSGVHAGADFLNQEYIRTGLLPTVNDIRAAAEHGFDKFLVMLTKDLEHSDVKYPVSKFQNNDIIREHIAIYVQLYAEVVLPTRKLELTEQFFKVPLTENFQFMSTLDAYGHGTLYDLKTGDIITPAHAQIGTYVYLLRNAGYTVHSAQLDYIHHPKPNDPPKHTIIKYDADACAKLAQYTTARLIGTLEEFLQTGDIHVIPINPRSASCNQVMCKLFSTSSCSGWRKNV